MGQRVGEGYFGAARFRGRVRARRYKGGLTIAAEDIMYQRSRMGKWGSEGY